jgi:hypothetical protein
MKYISDKFSLKINKDYLPRSWCAPSTDTAKFFPRTERKL